MKKVDLRYFVSGFTGGVCMCQTPWRNLYTPSWNRCLTTEGVSQLAPRPATWEYPASSDEARSGDSGVNPVIALIAAVAMMTPPASPKTPPTNRTTQPHPAYRLAPRADIA